MKDRILDLIQEWSNEFRSDDTLSLMEETMNNLRSQGKITIFSVNVAINNHLLFDKFFLGFHFPSPEKPKKELSEVCILTQPIVIILM